MGFSYMADSFAVKDIDRIGLSHASRGQHHRPSFDLKFSSQQVFVKWHCHKKMYHILILNN